MSVAIKKDTPLVVNLKAKIRQAVFQALAGVTPTRLFLIDPPDYPNVGDQAILLGELAFLKQNFPTAEICIVTHRTYHPSIDSLVDSSDVLFFHGGGNFGDIWPHHHEFRLKMLEKFKHKKIVQFPQSISFSAGGLLDRTRSVLAECKRLSLLVRDEKSLDKAERLLGIEAILSPDMAFYIGSLEALAPSVDVFCLMRTDKEVLEDKAEGVRDILQEQGLSAVIQDWLDESRLERQPHRLIARASRWGIAPAFIAKKAVFVFEKYATQRLNHGVKLLSSGRLVVVDRLHAHIITTLLDRPHYVFDSLDGKISALRNTWLAEHPVSTFVSSLSEFRSLSSQNRLSTASQAGIN